MVDADLVHHCADSNLKPAIVEQFIAKAGSSDPLSITVRSGDRVILIPPAKTIDGAMVLIRKYIGEADVRVGITQFPAGLGLKDPSELSSAMVDACNNIRIGTTLFGKVYRIVTKWYGTPTDEAFEDAVDAWKTGYFEGKAVFSAPDPGDIKVAEPTGDKPPPSKIAPADEPLLSVDPEKDDPNKAAIRVDLSGIGGAKR